MDEFLRRTAARRIVYGSDGALRERLTPRALLDLWCPLDGTEVSKRSRIALTAELRAAARAGDLVVTREPRTEVRNAPAGGWAVPYGKAFDSDLDELHATTAPRVRSIVVEWISRQAFREWLVASGAWPPEEGSSLRHWWPNEALPSQPTAIPRQPRGKDLLDEVKALEDAGRSVASAMQEVANRHGVTLAKVKSARYPKKDQALPKGSAVGNSRKKQVSQQH